MWSKILLLGALQIMLLRAHPLGSPGASVIWGMHLSDLTEPSQDDIVKMIELYNKESNGVYEPASKRAFTLLSRWRPFSNLGRNAPSIRDTNRNIYNDLDIETRAMLRPIGQPLRWG